MFILYEIPIHVGKYNKAAHLAPKVFAQNAELWENWIFRFAQQHCLEVRSGKQR